MAFDPSRLPREALIEEAFPGQTVPFVAQIVAVRCTLPGCNHTRGDVNPSLKVNPQTGYYKCEVSRATGNGWEDFITAWWGVARWQSEREKAQSGSRGPRKQETLEEVWARLEPERKWTEQHGLLPELSSRYLRRGRRWPSDPLCESVIGVFEGDQLRGIKFRIPKGASWSNGSREKYMSWKGSKTKDTLLLLDRADPNATILWVGGEKDALVAASRLDPKRWAPITGCSGERSIPKGAAKALKGRRVVIALDGDATGHHGAFTLCAYLRRSLADVRVAKLPEDHPPGAEKPGWDIAEVVEHKGPEELERILEEAGNPPPDWEPPKVGFDAQASIETSSPTTSSSAPSMRPSPSVLHTTDLDEWAELDGRTIEGKWKGRGEQSFKENHLRFDGVIRLTEVDEEHTEDEGAPGGWVGRETLTYEFRIADGPTVTTHCEAGPDRFAAELINTRIAPANYCRGSAAAARLFQWVALQSTPRRKETRKALGHHPEFGWLAPPNIAIKGGRITKTPFEVAAPGESSRPDQPRDLHRYRLGTLSDERFREVARWLLEELLECDHADGAYTLPIFAAYLAGPVRHYVPALRSWQWYTFFVQGPSGVGKTQLCRYFACLWGDFIDGKVSAWGSTAAAIEDIIHRPCSMPAFISDFKHSNFGSQRELRQARRLLQAYADKASRERCNSAAELKRSKPPRCQLIVDGEDLPEREQSTLGRMVIAQVVGRGESKLAANANSETLAPSFVRDLPGVTTRWLAWLQLHAHELEPLVAETFDALEQLVGKGSTNRTRVLRNHTVQCVALASFARFLIAQGIITPEQGKTLEWRGVEHHARHASAQLVAVQEEAADNSFLRTLVGLFDAGTLHLRTPKQGQDVLDIAKKANPYPETGRSTCVGEYDHDNLCITLWPEVAIPLVQRHVTQGGGQRIEFSERAIKQQLEQNGVLSGSVRQRRGAAKQQAWVLPLDQIKGEDPPPFDQDE